MIKNLEDITAAHKNAFDALMQIHTAIAQGFHEITEHVQTVTKQAIDMNIANGKAVTQIKSPQDFSAMQSQWANQALETAVGSSLKLAEITKKVSEKAAAPIQSHMTETFGKMSSFFPGKVA